MSNTDPMGQFGRRIAASVTRDPTFKAMFTDGRAIPTTWGNLASQLFELDLIEPDPEAAAAFLGIERADLADTTIRFTTRHEVDAYKDDFFVRKAGEFRGQHAGPARVFGQYMKDRFEAKGHEPDEPTLAQLKANVEALEESRFNAPNQPEHDRLYNKLALTKLAYDAHRSGAAVTLGEFAGMVLAYEDEAAFTRVERAKALRKFIRQDILNHRGIDHSTSVDEIMISDTLHRSFGRELGGIFSQRVMTYAEDQWQLIKPLFIAPLYQEHPLFAGNEK